MLSSHCRGGGGGGGGVEGVLCFDLSIFAFDPTRGRQWLVIKLIEEGDKNKKKKKDMMKLKKKKKIWIFTN